MAYEKTNWTSTTPINTTNLNKIEDGIEKMNKFGIYSTEEQVIGTWMDKPLYRKVLVLPNGTEGVTGTSGKGYNLSDFGINNVEDIFMVHPSFYTMGLNRIPFSFYDGNTFAVQVSPSSLLIICTYVDISVQRMVITLEYTKTTD